MTTENDASEPLMADPFSSGGAPEEPLMADPFSSNAGAAEVEGGAAVGAELVRLGEKYPEVVLVAADLGDSPLGSAFIRRFPERFFDFGIAETNSMSAAAGMAASGLKPYVVQMAAFGAMKCAEQIRTDMAATQVPVRIISAWSGLMMGYFGTSHHAVEDIAIARAITGLTVVAPSDGNSMRALLWSTVDHPGPVFFRVGTGEERPVHAEVPVVELGRFVRLREGSDVTIVATGVGVQAAVRAADALAEAGIEAEVYDALCLKPLDEEAIVDAARTTGRILTVEEHKPIGGLTSAVGEAVLKHHLKVDLASVTLPDEDLVVATPRELLKHYGVTHEGVADRVRELVSR
jgi:transketolase